MWVENRSAVVVRPKQPFADWAESIRESGESPTSLERLRHEPTIYLFESMFNEAHGHEMLKSDFNEIFEEQLGGWCTDETTWPKKRTFSLFQNWFEVEMASMIHDLGVSPLE